MRRSPNSAFRSTCARLAVLAVPTDPSSPANPRRRVPSPGLLRGAVSPGRLGTPQGFSLDGVPASARMTCGPAGAAPGEGGQTPRTTRASGVPREATRRSASPCCWNHQTNGGEEPMTPQRQWHTTDPETRSAPQVELAAEALLAGMTRAGDRAARQPHAARPGPSGLPQSLPSAYALWRAMTTRSPLICMPSRSSRCCLMRRGASAA